MTETCYCPTPLQHERATVLDRYFTGIETKVIEKPETFDGVPLMERLAVRQISRVIGSAVVPGRWRRKGEHYANRNPRP